jgi:preprotein translocase SecE subunit
MSKNITTKQSFATSLVGELKQVQWPTKQETIRLTTIVIVISLIIGAYIGIIDFLLAQGLKILTNLQ